MHVKLTATTASKKKGLKKLVEYEMVTRRRVGIYTVSNVPKSRLPNTTTTEMEPSSDMEIPVDRMKYWVKSIGPRYSRPSSWISINSPLLPSGLRIILQVCVSKGYHLQIL